MAFDTLSSFFWRSRPCRWLFGRLCFYLCLCLIFLSSEFDELELSFLSAKVAGEYAVTINTAKRENQNRSKCGGTLTILFVRV